MKTTIITIAVIYWLVSSFYIYLLLPKSKRFLAGFLFAIFTGPIIGPIKAIMECLAIFSDDEQVIICRKNYTGDK